MAPRLIEGGIAQARTTTDPMTDSRCGGEMGGGAITDDAGSTFRVSEPLRKIPAPLLLVEDSRLVRLALIRWLDRYVECIRVPRSLIG